MIIPLENPLGWNSSSSGTGGPIMGPFFINNFLSSIKLMSRPELRLKKKEYIRSKKRVPCHDCGQSFPEYCMDFHHIDEEEKAPQLKNIQNPSFSTYLSRWSIQRIDEEINKCVILCACCHRIRHHQEPV